MLTAFLDRRFSDADLRRMVTMASLVLAIVLVCLKTAGSLMTDSLSLLSSLIDSASDVVASLGTFVGVRAALLPADDNHRYGHGKAEAMAALGTAAFILGSAFFLFLQAFSRLIAPEPVRYGVVGAGVMLLSMVLTFLLVRFQTYVVRRTGSAAIAADQTHYTADFIANGATIAALLITTYTGFSTIDAFFGVGVAVWLVAKAVPVARDATNMLMDHELPDETKGELLTLVTAHPLVRGVHDMRTRRAGSDVFVELHVELDGDLPLKQAHAVGEQIEQALRQALSEADVTLHFDPAGIIERRRDDAIRHTTG